MGREKLPLERVCAHAMVLMMSWTGNGRGSFSLSYSVSSNAVSCVQKRAVSSTLKRINSASSFSGKKDKLALYILLCLSAELPFLLQSGQDSRSR